jgi:osmoprotectant transport system permease protein
VAPGDFGADVNLNYLVDHWQRVVSLAGDHLILSGIALGIALLFALPLGIMLSSWPRLSLPVLGLLGIIYTIPSLAFLAFLIPSLGLGRRPAIVVLAAYAQLALVRNIAAALGGVDSAIIEAGRGTGMTATQLFLRVKLPLALPVLIAGLRIAAVTTISLATITAWINAGGLGTLMFDGISRDNPPMILAGAVAIAALALVTDGLLRLLERATPASRAARGR